jgi:ergothioneine biosynthesis protein EgtB
LQPFRLANRLVTNGEYREFIAAGGYERAELWLSDGWSIVRREHWTRPIYWNEALEAEFTLLGSRSLDPNAPVCHLSYYEADAYARFREARLPSELEWEHAASGSNAADRVAAGNFVENQRWHPVAASAHEGALQQLFGDVWEWTQSAYSPYPGFKAAAGAIGEYNGKFMVNQLVLRGGSCATPRSHIRPTYRNFFYPTARWQFSGIRLAKDL